MNRKKGQNSDSLLEFPCRFPIKAMGKTEGSFEAVFVHIIRTHAELWPDEAIRSNLSREGNYLALTAVINATSREQLDTIYQELTDCPDVLMAL